MGNMWTHICHVSLHDELVHPTVSSHVCSLSLFTGKTCLLFIDSQWSETDALCVSMCVYLQMHISSEMKWNVHPWLACRHRFNWKVTGWWCDPALADSHAFLNISGQINQKITKLNLVCLAKLEKRMSESLRNHTKITFGPKTLLLSSL